MAANLLVDGIDEIEGAGEEVAGVLGGFDPDGEELGGEVSPAGCREGDHAGAEVRGGEVPTIVEETLGGVGVGVDDERGLVDGFGFVHAGDLLLPRGVLSSEVICFERVPR